MSLRPLIPVIISIGGGGKTLPLFQEKSLNDQSLNFSSIDDVNTTLELSSSNSDPRVYNPIPEGGEKSSSGLGGAAKKRKLQLFDDDDDETVDQIPSTVVNVDDPHVYNPMPLQWYIPEGGEILNLGVFGKKKNMSRKKPRRNDDVHAVDIQAVVPSIDEFPEVIETVESVDGSRPVFLYSKKLEESDVNANLNRLFLTNRETVVGFLNAAEVMAVDDPSSAGLTNIVGVDQRGDKHEHLKMKKWHSVNVTVMNADWKKMVAANDAEKGDFVHIWGFRLLNGELGLVVVFRKP